MNSLYLKTMSAAGIKYAIALLASLLLALTVVGQSKDDLQKQRDELNKQISYTKKLIAESEKTQQSTNQQLLVLNKQINLRQRLIRNMSSEIDEIEKDITHKQEEIVQLEEQITDLKEEYAHMLRVNYENRRAQDKVMYIFASDSFYQAYKRMKMMTYYTEIRQRQVETIKSTQDELNGAIAQLEGTRQEKQSLVSAQEEESSKLESDKKTRQKTLSSLKERESELRKQQQQQEEERQKLNKAIQRIIEEELRAEKNKNNGVYSLTPEGKIISANFEKNKGSLPWPVLRGVVTMKFGEQPHPSIPGIVITNNGVDITTDKDASVLAVFEGEVTQLFSLPGAGYNVIISHGAYRTVYTNLKAVKVKKGDTVSASEPIGTVISEGGKSIAHIEVWKVTSTGGTPQNPEYWLSKK
ncbi:MAG: peptidoglycan DD-metalloendopeptidase family protein [Flavobacteriales bacterium]|nr:peptidoglycan DD-metalloendopeptidase family protein [Flavobacteriales bacterium]